MGKLISFSGIDGAGKSTQITLLEKYLISKEKKVFTSEFMFGYFLLKPIIGTSRRLTRSPAAGPVRRNKNIIFKMWFVFAFIDIWLSYIFKTRRLLREYDFVIADRFYTDIWANLLYYGYIPNWAFSSLIGFLPTSDLSIILNVSPKVGKKRSDDFPLNYFTTQSKIYKELSNRIQSTVINVDRGEEQIAKDIRKQILITVGI